VRADVKAKWVEALRSGEYPQAQNALVVYSEHEPLGYCCLGVLGAVCGPLVGLTAEDIGMLENPEDELLSGTASESRDLTTGVLKRFGLDPGVASELMNDNDSEEASFEDLANKIEAEVEVTG